MRTSINVGSACVLFFFIGSFYATGVFNSAIDLEVGPESKLHGRWAVGMGFLTLLTAPVMVGSALYLNAGQLVPDGIKTRRVKVLGSIGALCFSGFFLAAAGVRQNHPASLISGVVMLGVPLGGFYFLCTELLCVWLPKRRGFAVGCGQAAFGSGIIVFSAVFDELVLHFGSKAAITISGLLLGFPAMIAAGLLSWPASVAPDDTECGKSENGTEHFPSGCDSEVVPIKTLFRDLVFWQYLITVFCSQTGFAMVPFFFEIGASYGLSTSHAVTLFQICNALGTFARLGGGVISDILGGRQAVGGARKLMAILLGIQTLGFGMLATKHDYNLEVFSFSATILFVSFSGGACVCALLARDLFGASNSATVFAVGGGLAIGLAESSASQMVSITLSHSSLDFGYGPSKFAVSFFILTAISFIGFITVITARRSKFAFPTLTSETTMTQKFTSTIYGAIR